MIVTEKNGPDGRAVRLRILLKSCRVLGKTPGPASGVLPKALATLDTKTLGRLDRDLALLTAALHADERAASIPLAQM